MRTDLVSNFRGGALFLVASIGTLAIVLILVFWALQRNATPASVAVPALQTTVQAPTGTETHAAVTTPGIATLSIGDMERILTDMSFDSEVMADQNAAPGKALANPLANTPTGPYLKVTRRGYSFFVRFYDCDDLATARECQTIEVVSGSFMLSPVPSPAEIISWNRQSWWAFAVADADGLPFLRSYFSTTGGVSVAFIHNFFKLWDWRVTEFAKFIKDLGDSREVAPD